VLLLTLWADNKSPVAQETWLEKFENERLPLGSLGTTAGWVMKRKQHVKRFPELPRRYICRICD